MLPHDQDELLDAVTSTLALYSKKLTAEDQATWWSACRAFSLEDVRRVLRDLAADPAEGKFAPKPIDVKRRIEAEQGAANAGPATCAASGAAGRCAYPGIFSDSVTGSERWYCPWHREVKFGPDAERWIEVSHKVPFAEARAKRDLRMLEEGQRALGVVDTSHAIALRHGNRPWRRGA